MIPQDLQAQILRDIKIKDSEIVVLKSKLKKISNEKDALETKIEKFKHGSQSLDKLIGSQVTDNSKKGLGYVSYNVVPPPHTGRFSSPRIDLSHTGLQEFAEPSVQSYRIKPIEVESDEEDKVEYPLEKEKKTVEPSMDKARSKCHQGKRIVNGTNHSRVYHSANTVPKAVLTRTGLKLVNSLRPVNPKRFFQRRTTYNNRNFFQKVNTVLGNEVYAVKASGC
nr:hypothetical protein [Tanacetum cinerariifolium]